ncbi:hypothetical protein AArcSl_2781 [Halalkaliarchaeum desulfuricum]|uniref:Uncharacterized protein n=1 Tax=Halalkaliarchaeum desulfuricum TaxID=2055893 RepID=A0A343TMS4_9EURY|nr:hypothetical protein [Halalkaliarchaeum desulfuricum]AUX10396.1 hypothetical protein AArcSl_2781 [Halalkaliarchaeum desulfuricum]
MILAMSTGLDRLRRPEYTGENRCVPCTLLNSVLAVILALAVGLVSAIAGFLVLLVSATAIYFRGYLVPGTPTITQRYFPDRVLQWFGKEPIPTQDAFDTDGGVAAEMDDGTDHVLEEYEHVGELLADAGIVDDCEDVDDLCLTPAFEEAWWDRIERFREGDLALEQLAAVLEVDPDDVSVTGEDPFEVTIDGVTAGRWSSRAAFLADLGAEPTLGEWLSVWDELDQRQSGELLASLRAFLERCPDCDGELTSIEDVTKTCCSGEYVNVSRDCTECGASVFNGSYR